MVQLKQNEELDYFGFRLSGCVVKGQAGKDPHSILEGLREYQSDTSVEAPSLGHHQGYSLHSYTRAHCLSSCFVLSQAPISCHVFQYFSLVVISHN